MSPFTVTSVSPRFSTVSIMPGMLARAPERTDRSRGFAGDPKSAPMIFSTRARATSTAGFSAGGNVWRCS
jgi:hypothetical protein